MPGSPCVRATIPADAVGRSPLGFRTTTSPDGKVLVTDVAPDGVASQGGLVPGVLLEVNGEPATREDDIAEALQAAAGGHSAADIGFAVAPFSVSFIQPPLVTAGDQRPRRPALTDMISRRELEEAAQTDLRSFSAMRVFMYGVLSRLETEARRAFAIRGQHPPADLPCAFDEMHTLLQRSDSWECLEAAVLAPCRELKQQDVLDEVPDVAAEMLPWMLRLMRWSWESAELADRRQALLVALRHHHPATQAALIAGDDTRAAGIDPAERSGDALIRIYAFVIVSVVGGPSGSCHPAPPDTLAHMLVMALADPTIVEYIGEQVFRCLFQSSVLALLPGIGEVVGALNALFVAGKVAEGFLVDSAGTVQEQAE
eukprot:TRINITY_DN22069_c0_g1_i1.p1 TRINITY_DN22069_c0_g1~~TRINITY_DN22069_c0_g1_i1.p1  ORF type:complete len:371 (+),score=95.72 TRINITY_DN22069_c0_g1_i1:38-1150(+)